MRRAPILALIALLGVGLLAWLLLGERTPEPSPKLTDTTDTGDDVTETELRESDVVWPADGVDLEGNDADAVAGKATVAKITGEVLDERGRGIDRARVIVVPVDPASLRGAPLADGALVASTETDAQGDFTLEQVPQGRWMRVIASHDGHATVGRLVPSAGAHVVLVLPEAGRLKLMIVDTDDEPVEGATVHASSGETHLTTTSSPNGGANFTALPPGAATVRVLMKERGSARAGPFVVRAGESSGHVVVVARGVALEGVVVDDETEAPIADARVRVATPGRALEATTDAQGRFGPLAAGGAGARVFLAVEAKGRAPLLEPVMLPAEGTQRVVLRLRKGTPWEGRVIDAAGKPVAGATVRYSADGIVLPMRGGSTTSDKDGRFVLPPPPPPAPGRRVVLVARAGAGLGALALRPDQLPPRPLELQLVAGATVRGRVVDGAGKARGGVTVRLGPKWDAVDRARSGTPSPAISRLHAFNAVGNQGLAAASGPDGRWQIDGVPAGLYRVWLREGTYERVDTDDLEIEGTSADVGDLVLDDALTLTGEVLDETGMGVAGATVLVSTGEGNFDRRRTQTDGRGWFTVPWLEGGQVGIRVGLGDRTASAVAVVEPDTENHIRIDMPASARLRLKVFEGDAAYRGLVTLAFGEIGSGRAATRRFTARVTGGEVVLDDVPVGDWTVEAFAPRGLRGQAQQVVTEAGRETPASLTLAKGARLHGTVRTEAGKGVAGAAIDLTHPETGGRVRATSDASGAFALEGLAAGAYTLEIRGRGGAPLRESLVLGAGEDRALDPTLPAGGSLLVRVFDGKGRPVPEALLGFRVNAGGFDRIRTSRPPRTDGTGRHTQGSLPLGRVIVTARDTDGRRGMAVAFVDAERTNEVDIEIRMSGSPR